jgi:sec-independent protein translocase protein TatA
MVGDILQPTHLLFVLVIALLVLGPKRLPEAGKALGKGLRDFRTAMSGEEHHEIHASAPAVQTVPAPAPVVATPAVATTVDTPAVATTVAPQPVAQSQGTDPMEPAHAGTVEPAQSVHTAS